MMATAAALAVGRRKGILALLRRVLLSEYMVLWLSVIYFICVAPFAPGFASIPNLQTILAYALPLLVVSVGLTLVLITGGIDLSVTSTIALASVVGGRIMSADQGWLAGNAAAVPAAVISMLAVSGLLGACNGGLITGFRIPPFIGTLVSMMFVSGFAIWTTLSRKIGGLPAGFLRLGQDFWISAGVVLATVLFAHFLLSSTIFGRWLRAIGHNRRAAVVSGVPVAGVEFFTYVLCGIYAGVASILFTAGLETGNPEMARDNLLDVVGAVVIGGTSLYGGKGGIPGTVFGVLFLAMVDNSLNLLGLKFYSIMMVKGGIILIAAIADVVRNRLASNR